MYKGEQKGKKSGIGFDLGGGGGAYGRQESGGGCACEERKGDESR